jgi:uncharacterized OB-fold protein
VKTRKPAAAGWFTADERAPRLLGSRCKACDTYAFPKETYFCRNPRCASSELEEVPLSSQGRLWSFTNNCYAPPPPYVAADPFVPYAIAAVELEREHMVVLGQVESGTDVAQLEVGMPMELCVGKLYEDAEHEFVTWKWRPLAAGRKA